MFSYRSSVEGARSLLGAILSLTARGVARGEILGGGTPRNLHGLGKFRFQLGESKHNRSS